MNRTRHLASRYLHKKTHKSHKSHNKARNNSKVVSLDMVYQAIYNLYMSDNNAILTSNETSYILNIAEQFNANEPDSQYHINPDGLLYAVKKLVIRNNKTYSGGVSPEHRMTTRSMTQMQAAQAELDALESESRALETRRIELREKISRNTREKETSTQLSTNVLVPAKRGFIEKAAEVIGALGFVFGLCVLFIAFKKIYNLTLDSTGTNNVEDSTMVITKFIQNVNKDLQVPDEGIGAYIVYMMDSFLGLGTCSFKVARTKLQEILPTILSQVLNDGTKILNQATTACMPRDLFAVTDDAENDWINRFKIGINAAAKGTDIILNARENVECIGKSSVALTISRMHEYVAQLNVTLNVATANINSIQKLLTYGTSLTIGGTLGFIPRLLRGATFLTISVCNIPKTIIGTSKKLLTYSTRKANKLIYPNPNKTRKKDTSRLPINEDATRHNSQALQLSGGKSYRKNKHRKNKNKNKKQHH